MKNVKGTIFTLLALACVAATRAQDGSISDPLDPAEVAQFAERDRLIAEALRLEKGGESEGALREMRRAVNAESAMKTWQAGALHQLALLLARQGQGGEAISTFSEVFKWDSARNDLTSGSGSLFNAAMDYAILLARSGKADEAKALYYYALRRYNPTGRRELEPVPLLTVFDPDIEGVVYEYSPAHLEAAALVIKACDSGDENPVELLDRAKNLWPEWFIPHLWLSVGYWHNVSQMDVKLSEIEALARPGQERDSIAKYRTDLAAHRARNKAHKTPLIEDKTPMKEGVNKRSKMKCLEPDGEILSRITKQH